MAGNSKRRGAVAKPGKKKGASAGSGGQKRRGLEGKGPTPKAKDRPYHKAHQKAQKQGGGTSERPRGKRRAAGSGEWIAGRNAVVEALRESVPAEGIYVAEGAERDSRLKEAFGLAADRGIALFEASRSELDTMTGDAVHQGVAARVRPYEYAHADDLLVQAEQAGEPPLVIVLDHVTDPRNLGAIVRSAAAFGAHGVVIPERRSAAMTAAAWKTSAGAAARIPVARVVNVTQQLKAYQEAGCMVVGLDMAGDVTLPELDLADGPLVVAVGAEGGGLSRLVRETCDQIVSIPMAGAVESLNAGVAASVTMYQIAQVRASQ